MAFIEHMTVTMRADAVLNGRTVPAGTIGTIVHVHGAGAAFMVEFPGRDDPVIATVTPDMIAPINAR